MTADIRRSPVDAATVIGIDLSGPHGFQRTAAVAFDIVEGRLHRRSAQDGADDRDILELAATAAETGPVVIGIDAPLSYQSGGGDRPADRQLRRRVVAAGLTSGTVMPPTLTRMAYLTLRGVVLTRLLRDTLGGAVTMVEVHPAAAMVLRGAPVGDVRQFSSSERSRQNLLKWHASQGVDSIARHGHPVSGHYVAACAAALAAWQWHLGRACWSYPAEPPFHPFDVAC